MSDYKNKGSEDFMDTFAGIFGGDKNNPFGNVKKAGDNLYSGYYDDDDFDEPKPEKNIIHIDCDCGVRLRLDLTKGKKFKCKCGKIFKVEEDVIAL